MLIVIHEMEAIVLMVFEARNKTFFAARYNSIKEGTAVLKGDNKFDAE